MRLLMVYSGKAKDLSEYLAKLIKEQENLGEVKNDRKKSRHVSR